MCIDHLGNRFNSVIDMCNYYHVKPCTYYERLEHGNTLEQALIGIKQVFDHMGNRYTKVLDMCHAYGVSTGRYYWRRKHGWSVEEALTGIRKKD